MALEAPGAQVAAVTAVDLERLGLQIQAAVVEVQPSSGARAQESALTVDLG